MDASAHAGLPRGGWFAERHYYHLDGVDGEALSMPTLHHLLGFHARATQSAGRDAVQPPELLRDDRACVGLPGAM